MNSFIFQALETRLLDLAKAFEEATIDKMDQLEKTIQMQTAVDRAADLRQVISRSHILSLRTCLLESAVWIWQ